MGAALRTVLNRVVGPGTRVVHVLTGPARGRRLELELQSEKAYWLGVYEPEVQELLRATIRPADIVYDVGANIGFFSVLVGGLGARVVALEPAPDNARRIRRNAELNGFAVEVVEAAVWDEAGEGTLVSGGSRSEWHVEPGPGVVCVTLDQIAELHGAPDVIKIDVEGAEARALRGATAVLARRPKLVICEIHDEEAERIVRELFHGWRLENVGGTSRLAARPPL